MRSTPQSLPGLETVEHELEVPLDHSDPSSIRLTVFAREVRRPGPRHENLPWLLFLQGGPGFPAPRPVDDSGWIGHMTRQYRVLLLDQRGTGRSSPVTHETLAVHGDPASQAEYLGYFRADSIVADAELFRRELLGPGGRWTLLGQSFGGFCSLSYLSRYPESLEAVLITGGLASLDAPVEEVYRRTFAKLAEKNAAYYARYPRDLERASEIAAAVDSGEVLLPSGDRLTRRRLQSLGIGHGSSTGFEALHHLLEGAFVDGPGGRQLAYAFLKEVEGMTAYDTNPIYALLHEAIYMQGAASGWAADRVRAEYPAFDDPAGPLLFTAEMIHPWMFEDWSVLAPLAPVAELLAARTDWPALYDPERLAANEVPVAAAVYHDDAYVPVDLSLETARRVKGLRAWVTSEYEHDGLRADGPRILDRLLGLVRGNLVR